MDINKVQKLNKLALDLKKYNLGSNQGESAVSAAEKIYGEENNYMTRHSSQEKKDENMENNDRDIRNLSIAVKNNEERINQIISKINEMVKEFNEVKENIKSLKVSIDNINRQPISSQQTLTNATDQTKKQQVPEQKKASQNPIDRNGVSPSDISIDKYFYCGKK